MDIIESVIERAVSEYTHKHSHSHQQAPAPQNSTQDDYYPGPSQQRAPPPDSRYGPPPSGYSSETRRESGYYESQEDRYGRQDEGYERPDDRYGRPGVDHDRYGRSEERYEREDDGYGRTEERYGRSEDRYERPNDGYGRSEDRYERTEDRYDDRYGRPDDRYERRDYDERRYQPPPPEPPVNYSSRPGQYDERPPRDTYNEPRDAYEAPRTRYDQYSSEAYAPPSQTRGLHQLVRPAKYPTKHHRPSFYAAYARAARRYSFEATKWSGFAKRGGSVVKVRSRHDKEADHEVPAEGIQNDSEYVVRVQVGNPGVVLHLDFDTGSSDLWVWSSELAGASNYNVHAIYDPRVSSTARKVHGYRWQISYGDGSSASGDVYTDYITVAGVTVPNQSVELANELSPSFLQDGGNDGLLGLAWPNLNTVQPRPVKTPVQNMMEQGLIEQPLFTVKLSRENEPGFYSFGYIDHSVTSYPISYTPVDNSQGFWQVPSTYWAINGQGRERPNNTAILDTGTTLCLVSDDVLEHIYHQIQGATYDDHHGGWKYPSNARIPQVQLSVGDILYTIAAEDFEFGNAGDGYILGGFQSRGDLEYDIFGDVFLKNVYAIFNQGEKTVGLAQRED